jgi:uncharacterized protein YdcH (DUF465 family)
MEKNDETLIERYIDQDEELRRYVEDHRRYEKALEGFNARVYLTPEEEVEKKKIQKLKLQGKDKIHEIIARYREK